MRTSDRLFALAQLVYLLVIGLASWLVAEVYLLLVWGDTPVPMDGLALSWGIVVGPGWFGHIVVLLYALRRWYEPTATGLLLAQVLIALTAAALMGALFVLSELFDVSWIALVLIPLLVTSPAIATAIVYGIARKRDRARHRSTITHASAD